MFRYPGGKLKAKKFITSKIKKYYKINNSYNLEYIEPFFGSGSICLGLLNSMRLNKICINDTDPGIACFWASIIHFPDVLCKKVEEYIPSVDDFYKFKKELRDSDVNSIARIVCNKPSKKCIEIGFKKLVIHKISYSGLGTMAGGPMGGKEQLSNFKVDCRWNSKTIIKDIKKCN
ncbi:MAG: DNA adenine methylase, partial [Clostridiales bacterium]|nr:DNA adenine methylase [Clostridiales bacterium]